MSRFLLGGLTIAVAMLGASGCLRELVIVDEGEQSDTSACSDVDCTNECRPGLSACAGECVDLQSNVEHCGGCDQPCDGFCVDGECQAECEAPMTVCGSACVDLDSNLLHCEECGEVCDADEVCVEGKCRDYAFAQCTSCPCECGDENICCESTLLDAVLCVYDEACPP